MPDLRFFAIGTQWSIETLQPLDAAITAAVFERVEAFDATYSRFRADSLVTTISRGGGTHRFPDDAAELFDLYDRLFDCTSGAVTPLIGRSLEQLGYDSDYSMSRRGADLPPPNWSTMAQRAGSVLTLSEPALIDVGAAGKGYLVDLVAAVLRAAGVNEFTIDASGDLLISENRPRRVALEHPLDPSLAIGVVEISNGSICASGSNRRVWGSGLHHVLDGRTGSPTNDVIATWALTETALAADGLATALFFTTPELLAQTFDFAWVRMFPDGRAEASENLTGELFL